VKANEVIMRAVVSLPVGSRWGASAALAMALLWPGGAVPAEAAFSYVRNLRVPPAQVTGGPHTDFPVLVQFTNDPLLRTAPAGRISSSQGFDIQFRAADQVTILDHEVELYDGVTGTLVAWVRLPVLQSLADNDFSMFYGDPSVTCARYNPERVWNADYRYVYHLGESAGNPADSTANAVAATINPPGTLRLRWRAAPSDESVVRSSS
jgi:MSHA biogenesis protein MshQ